MAPLMQTFPFTSVFTFIFTIHIIYLAMQVVRLRRKYQVGYGDGKNTHLRKAIAAHSNAVENIPLALILILLLELNQVNNELILLLASLFLAARIFQAFGLLQSLGVSHGRTYGTMFSWILMCAMGGINVFYIFF